MEKNYQRNKTNEIIEIINFIFRTSKNQKHTPHTHDASDKVNRWDKEEENMFELRNDSIDSKKVVITKTITEQKPSERINFFNGELKSKDYAVKTCSNFITEFFNLS